MSARLQRVSSLFITPLVLGFIGLLFCVALINNSRDLSILCLLIIGMTTGAKLWSKLGFEGTTGAFTLQKGRVFAGEDFSVTLAIENRRFLPFWVEAHLPCEDLFSTLSSEEEEPSLRTGLLWHQAVSSRRTVTARKRGVYRIGPLDLTVGDFLGHFQSRKDLGKPVDLVVYPRLVSLLPVVFPKGDFFGVPGSPSPVHDPVYILGTTDYHHGRPARFIHWKASARHNRLQVKLFESTEQEKILFCVDVREYAALAAEEAFERSLETVASLAVRLDRQGCSVGLLTNGITRGTAPSVPVARGPRQLPAILEVLARIQMSPRGGSVGMIGRMGRVPWGTTCLYFVHSLSGEARSDIEYLRRSRAPFQLYTQKTVDALRRDEPEDDVEHGDSAPLSQGQSHNG